MNWWEIGQDFLMLVAVVAVPALLAPLSMYVFRKLQEVGINIDAGHRDSYTAAAVRAAGGVVLALQDGKITAEELSRIWQDIESGGNKPMAKLPEPIVAAVKVVQKSAPDALKYFKLDQNLPIVSKIIGLVGGLVAPGTIAPVNIPHPQVATSPPVRR